MLRAAAALALLCLPLTACPKPGDSDTDGPGSSSTTDTVTTGGDATDGGSSSTTSAMIGEHCDAPAPPMGDPASPDLAPECACVDPLEGWVTCWSPICPELTGVCHPVAGSDFDCFKGTWTYDETALTCALEAARDGTEGTLPWYLSPDGNYSGNQGYIHILPGRRILRQDRAWSDLAGYAFDTDLWQLRDAAYFEGCLALASPCERMHCLFAGTTGPALSRCAPGYMYNP